MEIGWLTAFIDMPADRFEVGTRFWLDVTGSQRSRMRGEHQEFATLHPPTGDPYLRVQRVGDDEPRIHLDLHVDSIPDATERAVDLGAAVVADLFADLGWVIMKSPGGYVFCFVAYEDEVHRTQPRADLPHLVDQLSIDIPAPMFESECRFWEQLTGWELRQSRLEEFVRLAVPQELPLRMLMQRLGEDDRGTAVRAHLDIACGENIDAVAVEHERLGAKNLGRRKYWTTMLDPAGLPYCLTPRDPESGAVPQAG
jgi:predicted enzyme related to lactoylglutathione lyase